ncbi:PAS domain-containing hybrid sensor histidine kinase/response regulator [Piscinibacter sp. HJYY11]|uniref:PAS domain-containing hybrid sensor histidine kinase/response regulator n=1 Tax=Piscinibacter sp. HJYY11 TaxID=2801333 RepID=UPI00191DBC0C|nr:PAS domain-containing hybrid sensor histidine kinase/response regulator [Piscinibacter sp. HJYY11]MBL0730507.1 PAS domain-containing protein [Piscinibacter sp. HJYY11]
MDGIDQLWWRAPGPALRLAAVQQPRERHSAGDWQVNPAATAWAKACGLQADRWASLATTLREQLDAGQTEGRTLLTPAGIELGWTAVPLASGWLVWLDVSAEIADRLRTSEATAALWVRAVDLAAVALWRLDLLNQRVYFSDWGYTMLGLDPVRDRLTVEQLRELIHPDDRAAVVAAAEEAVLTRGVVDVEARYRHRSGQYRNLYTRRVAEYDAQGTPIGLSGVTIDMTEQIAERERAQAYAERIDRVTNAAGVGIWSVDIDTRKIEWNEQMYRLYGIPREQAPPPNEVWLNQLVHPDDREIARHHRPVTGTGPQGLHAEFRIVRPNGAVRWVASWSRREVLGGRDLAFGVNLDITNLQRTQAELRQTQERARLATESAGIGTWERDLRTGRAKWDAQMYRLRGLPVGPETPPDDMRYAAYHPEDLENINRNKARAGQDGDSYENEFRVVFPDGSIRWLATRGLVKRDAHGDPEKMLGVTWDITERRRAEQALREKAAAVQASAAKSQFLARMSHELRTPLNAVLGFAQLMGNDLADRLSHQQRQRVDRIHSAGLHLLALIDDVLDLATIESDALPLTYETVSLQASLDDVLQWTQLQASQAAVQIHAQAVRGWVRADPRRVRQILSNLISNAIKYNRPQGQVWIACQATTHRDQAAWTLSVRDTGRGLSAEQCQQLFQPFNRLGAERGTIPGTGIGLAIVHHLVRLMGGDLTVTSEPGRGSEFRVTLPAERPPEPVEREPHTTFHADLGDDPASSARLNVLYIEDNPVNVVLVQELVALRPDVSLSVAVDGLSGVTRAVAELPHVVLVDMQLPDIDGFEVLRRLKAEPMLSDATIVALSANAMPEDVNRAKQAGFDDYWTKPIDFHAFLRNLTSLAQVHLV